MSCCSHNMTSAVYSNMCLRVIPAILSVAFLTKIILLSLLVNWMNVSQRRLYVSKASLNRIQIRCVRSSEYHCCVCHHGELFETEGFMKCCIVKYHTKLNQRMRSFQSHKCCYQKTANNKSAWTTSVQLPSHSTVKANEKKEMISSVIRRRHKAGSVASWLPTSTRVDFESEGRLIEEKKGIRSLFENTSNLLKRKETNDFIMRALTKNSDGYLILVANSVQRITESLKAHSQSSFRQQPFK